MYFEFFKEKRNPNQMPLILFFFADEMIMLFLHSCYYSPERSKDTIENYYTMRAKCPEFFANWDFNGLSEGWNLR